MDYSHMQLYWRLEHRIVRIAASLGKTKAEMLADPYDLDPETLDTLTDLLNRQADAGWAHDAEQKRASRHLRLIPPLT